jgi:type III secretory pathway component EscT
VDAPWLSLVLDALDVDVGHLVVALARVAPVGLLVPALGLHWWPAPLRWGFSLVLALSVMPLVGPAAPVAPSAVWEAASRALLSSIPVALSAAALLWAVAMAAGVYDQALRAGMGAQAVEDDGSPALPGLSALVSLGVGIAFLEMGGPARVAKALLRSRPAPGSLSDVATAAVSQLLSSIEIAVGFALPALAVMVMSELVIAVARGASVSVALEAARPLRPVVALALIALLLSRVVEEMAAHVDAILPV